MKFNLHKDKFENWYKICIRGTDDPGFLMDFNENTYLYTDPKINIFWYTWMSAIQLTWSIENEEPM